MRAGFSVDRMTVPCIRSVAISDGAPPYPSSRGADNRPRSSVTSTRDPFIPQGGNQQVRAFNEYQLPGKCRATPEKLQRLHTGPKSQHGIGDLLSNVRAGVRARRGRAVPGGMRLAPRPGVGGRLKTYSNLPWFSVLFLYVADCIGITY